MALRSLELHQSQELLKWIIRFDAATVRERVEAMRRRWPDDSSFALAQRAFDQAGLWVIGAGVVTGLAANPLLGVVGTLADLSITVRTQIFAAACAAELLIPVFLPVLGGLLGGGWNAVEVRLVRDRTLR